MEYFATFEEMKNQYEELKKDWLLLKANSEYQK